MDEQKTVKGFKGFNNDMTCQGFQFEVGKTYKHKGDVKLCATGFHFCEHPLDVFAYYPPNSSKFSEVEAAQTSPETHNDTKRVCAKITVKAELNLSAMITSAVKFVFDKADWSKKETQATGDSGAASATGDSGAASATGDSGAASATGDSGAASATGDSGAASATGDRGAASATGDSGAASATGKEGVACAFGIGGKAMGAKGAWITLAEWKIIKNKWHRIDVQTKQVDGEKIKAEVWYILKDGKFAEV